MFKHKSGTTKCGDQQVWKKYRTGALVAFNFARISKTKNVHHLKWRRWNTRGDKKKHSWQKPTPNYNFDFKDGPQPSTFSHYLLVVLRHGPPRLQKAHLLVRGESCLARFVEMSSISHRESNWWCRNQKIHHGIKVRVGNVLVVKLYKDGTIVPLDAAAPFPLTILLGLPPSPASFTFLAQGWYRGELFHFNCKVSQGHEHSRSRCIIIILLLLLLFYCSCEGQPTQLHQGIPSLFKRETEGRR
jgi:hypothetical protein